MGKHHHHHHHHHHHLQMEDLNTKNHINKWWMIFLAMFDSRNQLPAPHG